MPFPFTFSFFIPGLPNPFTQRPRDPLAPPSVHSKLDQTRTLQTPAQRQYHSQGPLPLPGTRAGLSPAPAYPNPYPSAYPSKALPITGTRRISRADLPKINRPRPSPSLSPSPAPLSRKRGWEPDLSPTWSTTSLTLASSSGYLDTPSKYKGMAAASGRQDGMSTDDQDYRHNDDQREDDEMPPLKKRRGLAGSIVSTAVSAALIGTAVGLTVYRLWRDRGKDAQIEASPHEVADPSTQPPPPPYEEADWKPLPEPAAIKAQPHAAIPVTPKSVQRKRRPAPVSKRPIAYHSARRSRPTPVVSPAPARSEFDFGRNDECEADEADDKMDWIGDKLAMLIEQGKRALNSEVVVFSEAKEDEIDDGSGSWEEEDELQASRAPSRAGSIRRGKKPKNIANPSAGLGINGVKVTGTSSLSSSPRRSGFANGYTPSLPIASTSTTYVSASPGFVPSSLPRSFAYDSPGRTHVRGISYESALPPSFSPAPEDSSQWESPELRQSMEIARAKLLARRAGA